MLAETLDLGRKGLRKYSKKYDKSLVLFYLDVSGKSLDWLKKGSLPKMLL